MVGNCRRGYELGIVDWCWLGGPAVILMGSKSSFGVSRAEPPCRSGEQWLLPNDSGLLLGVQGGYPIALRESSGFKGIQSFPWGYHPLPFSRAVITSNDSKLFLGI